MPRIATVTGILATLFLTGCQTVQRVVCPPTVSSPKLPGYGDGIDAIMVSLPGTIGVLAIFAGLVLGIFTRFTLGLGVALIGAGFGMMMLAYFFSQPFLPWLAMGTVFLFSGYKFYMLKIRKDPEEHLLD